MVSYLPIRREKIDRIRQATKEDDVMSVLSANRDNPVWMARHES